MTDYSTVRRLEEMRLPHMADAYRRQMDDPSFDGVSFSDRLGLIVDAEYDARRNNRLHRLIHAARFDQPMASVQNIDYTAGRKLDEGLIARLATCEYIKGAHNVIIVGATGVGKSYLACALGMEACKHFYSAKYVRLPDLLVEMATARALGTFAKLMAAYTKVRLLIIDEWLLVKISEGEARDLLEIIHKRHKSASTMFCSQFAPAGWFSKIKESTLAEAILDRIVHDSYLIDIVFPRKEDEKSMREVYGINRVQK